MRVLSASLCLVFLAGCSSAGKGGGEAPPLTGDSTLNRRLAELRVTSCTVGGLPSSKAGGPVRARASTRVASKDPADPHRARIRVYDPQAAELKDPDSDGNLLIPAGGALVALTAAGGAAIWFVHDRDKGGREVDIAPGGDTPVSVRTSRPTDPDRTSVSAKTPRGSLDCTPVASTEEAVLALAPLTPEDAGQVTFSASEGGTPVGEESATAVSTSIWFVPEVVKSGETGSLFAEFLPGGRNLVVTITLQGGIQAQPVLLFPGQIQGSAGQFIVILKGNGTQLSHTALFTVVGTDQPIQAAVQAEEVK